MAWTRTKRMSVQRYGVPGVLPNADGSIDVGDRAHVAGLFAADSYPSPVVPTPVTGNQIKHITARVFGHKGFETWRVEIARRPWQNSAGYEAPQTLSPA